MQGSWINDKILCHLRATEASKLRDASDHPPASAAGADGAHVEERRTEPAVLGVTAGERERMRQTNIGSGVGAEGSRACVRAFGVGEVACVAGAGEGVAGEGVDAVVGDMEDGGQAVQEWEGDGYEEVRDQESSQDDNLVAEYQVPDALER